MLTLVGAIFGNLRAIALSTLVTILVPEDGRDRANGMVGTANGVAFLGASILSGLAIGYLGVFWMLAGAIVLTVLTIVHLLTLALPIAPNSTTKRLKLTPTASTFAARSGRSRWCPACSA